MKGTLPFYHLARTHAFKILATYCGNVRFETRLLSQISGMSCQSSTSVYCRYKMSHFVVCICAASLRYVFVLLRLCPFM